MGGLMSYQRMRGRNRLAFRKPDSDPDPYWRGADDLPEYVDRMLVGDLNRMERDYLRPDSGLVAECVEATRADADTVRRVLRWVFLEQP